MAKRPAGSREIHRSRQRPLRITKHSSLGEALAQCLATIEVALGKYPPEVAAGHAAIDHFAEQIAKLKAPADDVTALPLAEAGLSTKTVNFLEQEGIETVGDLLAKRRTELRQIPRIGRATLEEIFLCLQRLGFKIPPAEDLGMA